MAIGQPFGFHAIVSQFNEVFQQRVTHWAYVAEHNSADSHATVQTSAREFAQNPQQKWLDAVCVRAGSPAFSAPWCP